jgi:uncharacterized membrane protein
VIPRAISPVGVVVGQAIDTGDDPQAERAWVWESGSVTALPTLVPDGLYSHAGAYGVNRAGKIVGFSASAGGSHAVLWRRQ